MCELFLIFGDCMKKAFLSVLMLWMSTVAMAQTPKITKEEKTIKKVEWSKILPERYANCISVKNKDGTPKTIKPGVIVKPGDEFFFVECEDINPKDGIYDGISDDKKTVMDSDAVRACHNLGMTPSGKKWELAGEKEYIKFKDNDDFQSLAGTKDEKSWLSLISLSDPNFAYGFFRDGNGADNDSSRSGQHWVRCVGL
jgi:hypothetical protein